MRTSLKFLIGVAAVLAAATAFDIETVNDEPDAMATFKLSVESGWQVNKDDGHSIIAHAMERGWWQFSSSFVSTAKEQGVDLTSSIHRTANTIRRKLTGLAESLQARRRGKEISPAFQWAQSPDSVFLNVKFSHKWDTPATLGCVEDGMDMTNSSVRFRVECKEKRKTFELDIPLFKEITPENSTWSMSSVGRATITLAKARNETWSRLLKKGKRSNMHMWWALHEKYEKDNEETTKQNILDRSKKPTPSPTPAAATPEPAATPTPEPTPEPTPSPFDLKKKEKEAELAAKIAEADAIAKTTIRELESNARAEKRQIDESARSQKRAVEEGLAEKRKAELEAARAKREALEAEHRIAIEELRKELGARDEL